MSQLERVAPPTAVVALERDFRLRRRLRRDKMACQVGGVSKRRVHGKLKTSSLNEIPPTPLYKRGLFARYY